MRKRNIPRASARQRSSVDSNPLSWKYFIVVMICGCILVAGFFFAARQHFTSMDFGIRNSRLRKQLEDLESENRRLLLAREVSLSPGQIKKTARTLGFREIPVNTVAAVNEPAEVKIKAESSKPAEIKLTAVTDKLTPVKTTGYQRSVKTSLSEPSLKGEAVEKRVRKIVIVSNNKKDKPEITTIAKLR